MAADADESPPASSSETGPIVGPNERAVTDVDDLPPVVARLVVEIRSDGTRTVARGALEDVAADEQVAVQMEAGSPLGLLRQLSADLFALPAMLRPDRPRRPSLRDRLRKRLTRRR